MNLKTAQHYADHIVQWVSPFCERIEIVGSIRRHRPICNDVDLVCIPKTSSETRQVDLLATEQVVTNRLRQFLITYVRESKTASWLGRSTAPVLNPVGVAMSIEVPSSGPEPKSDAQNLLLLLPKCQLDIFCATDQTFATLKLCRTGSKEHNIWLADRAKTFGGHWNPYKGLTLPDGFVNVLTEEEIYTALKLPFIAPENRELDYLRSLR